MKEKDYTQLNDYFNGVLADAERKSIEQRLKSDPEFAADFQQQESMEKWLSEEPGRQKIRKESAELGKAFFPDEKSEEKASGMQVSYRRPYLTALAAAFALVLAALWFFKDPGSNDLYAQFGEHPSLQLVMRGNEDQSLQSQAEKAFNSKNYAAALPLLEQIYRSDSSDTTAKLYAGICQIELRDFAGARQTLLSLTQSSSILKNEAVWYNALSYVREGDMASAKSALGKIEPQSDYYDKAQKLLKAM